MKKSMLYFSALLSFCFLSPLLHAQTKTTAYTYDALGRLTFVSDSVNGNRDYDYDKAGNRLLVSTNTVNDGASEPGVGHLPAPTGQVKTSIADCAWKATWNAVPGATRYLVKETSGASQSVTGTIAYVNCPRGNPTGNQPRSVQACTSTTACGLAALF